MWSIPARLERGADSGEPSGHNVKIQGRRKPVTGAHVKPGEVSQA
ncbi:hypothetical protein [Acetobacter sicerae]|nr:hypothetical protein [Acetobacter sicerae]